MLLSLSVSAATATTWLSLAIYWRVNGRLRPYIEYILRDLDLLDLLARDRDLRLSRDLERRRDLLRERDLLLCLDGLRDRDLERRLSLRCRDRLRERDLLLDRLFDFCLGEAVDKESKVMWCILIMVQYVIALVTWICFLILICLLYFKIRRFPIVIHSTYSELCPTDLRRTLLLWICASLLTPSLHAPTAVLCCGVLLRALLLCAVFLPHLYVLWLWH